MGKGDAMEHDIIVLGCGPAGLSAVFEALAAAEFSVKSGARSPLQAMESLVAQLTLIFGARS